MLAFSKKLSGLPGMFVLLFLFTMYSSLARAEMPDAQSRIGTQATITFSDDKGEHTKKSDPVYTVVAQVHQVEVKVMNDKTPAMSGQNADIAFALTNIGNGTDDMTITAKNLPANVDSVTVFEADEGGRATSEAGQVISAGSGQFSLANMKRRELRNFVVRMRVPLTTKAGQELRIDLVATPSNADEAAKQFSGSALAIDSTPFTVTPGKSATLDDQKNAAVAFVVTPGAVAVDGYFELFMTKRNDPRRLKFEVLNNEVHFDGETVDEKNIKKHKGQLSFEMIHKVPAEKSSAKVNFNMRIYVPDAAQGDEMLLYVNYSKGKDTTVQPEENVTLVQSNGLLVSWPHGQADFSLAVTGNSIDKISDDFATVASATAGSDVDYEITLENNGSQADTYVFERLKSEGALILSVTAMNRNGQDEIRIGTNGLPEIGPLAAHGSETFKVRVRLVESRLTSTPQIAKFRIKSGTAKALPSKEQELTINTIVTGASASVVFLEEASATQPIVEYKLPAGQNDARIYVKVVNADPATHQYQIVSNKDEITLFPYVNGVCDAVAVNATGPVGSEGKLFCVNADMQEQSRLDGTVIFTDIATAAVSEATIAFVKPGALRFAGDSYQAGGTAGLTADITVAMINRGGDVGQGKYEVWFDTTDSGSKTNTWKITFSLDKKDWIDILPLPAMDAGKSVPLFIKVEVPPGVSEEEKWPLRVGIREPSATSNISLTTISLSLNVIDLKVLKQVAIVKKSACDAAAVPSDFAASSAHEITDGDCIWYRVTVTNVSTMTASQMIVRDPLPKHATYSAGMATVVADEAVGVAMQDNSIVTDPTALAINKKLVLTYPVQVDFSK